MIISLLDDVVVALGLKLLEDDAEPEPWRDGAVPSRSRSRLTAFAISGGRRFLPLGEQQDLAIPRPQASERLANERVARTPPRTPRVTVAAVHASRSRSARRRLLARR